MGKEKKAAAEIESIKNLQTRQQLMSNEDSGGGKQEAWYSNTTKNYISILRVI